MLAPAWPVATRAVSRAVGWRLSCFTWLLVTVASMAQTLPGEIPLPPGYTYPRQPYVHIPDPLFDPPGASCPSCANAQANLRFYYRDFVGLRLNLDRYGTPAISWEMVIFEHGFKTPWRGPQDAIRLYQHSADQVRVVTRERLVVFQKTAAADGSVTLKCVSDDDWSLARDGDRILVKSPQRTFAFETPDLGATWRLVETCIVGFPFPAKLVYDGPSLTLPTALVYPDGARVTFKPTATNPDVVGRIAFPNGCEFKLEYDPNGFPRSLEEYAPSEEPAKRELTGFTIASTGGQVKTTTAFAAAKAPKLELINLYVWENDPLGRIATQETSCGSKVKLEFAEATLADGTKEQISIVRDVVRNTYRYMRFHEKGDTWINERGTGQGEQPLEQAKYDTRTVQKSINHEMKLVESRSGDSPNVLKIEYDAQAKELSRTQFDPAGKVLWTRKPRPPARPTTFRSAADLTKDFAAACAGPAYGYDDSGLLTSASLAGKTYQFRFDTLGRMVRREGPDGAYTTYAYHHGTKLTDLSQYAPAAPPSAPGVSATASAATTPPATALTPTPTARFTYTYNNRGQVRTKAMTNDLPRTYHYTCDGLERQEMGAISVIDYRYDDQQRLHQLAIRRHPKSKSAGQMTPQTRTYRYRPDGRLGSYRQQDDGQPPLAVTYTYDPASGARQIRELTGQPAPNMLTEVAATISHGDGSRLTWERYNRLGGVISQGFSALDTGNP